MTSAGVEDPSAGSKVECGAEVELEIDVDTGLGGGIEVTPIVYRGPDQSLSIKVRHQKTQQGSEMLVHAARRPGLEEPWA
jgi:hypothetical protein